MNCSDSHYNWMQCRIAYVFYSVQQRTKKGEANHSNCAKETKLTGVSWISKVSSTEESKSKLSLQSISFVLVVCKIVFLETNVIKIYDKDSSIETINYVENYFSCYYNSFVTCMQTGKFSLCKTKRFLGA